MTSITAGFKLEVFDVRQTLQGEILNAFKNGRGRVLPKPVLLDAPDGRWAITKIIKATWNGPAVLSAKVEVVPPHETLTGARSARFELDFRSKQHDVVIAILRT